MAAGINPFALQMQQLQRRQALADQLMQQGNQPLDTQVVGNVAVRRSPFEGIAKLAQAATGAYVQNKNDQTYQDLAAQMMAGQRSALSPASLAVVPLLPRATCRRSPFARRGINRPLSRARATASPTRWTLPRMRPILALIPR
jgi:hypothetical protein